MARREWAEARFAATQAELNEERASALERLGRRLEVSYARYLAAAEARRDDDPGTVTAHRDARAAFEALRWELTVHREALGLTDHRFVERTYPMAERDRRPSTVDDQSEAQRRWMAWRLSR